MDDHSAVTVTVPTELRRVDPFICSFVLISTVLLTWWAYNSHVVQLALPFVPLVFFGVATSEPATDVPFLGAVAAGVRAKLGMRSAHEWAGAWIHYFRVALWPEERERWQHSRLKSKMVRTLTNCRNSQTLSTVRLSSKRLHSCITRSPRSALVRVRLNGRHPSVVDPGR